MKPMRLSREGELQRANKTWKHKEITTSNKQHVAMDVINALNFVSPFPRFVLVFVCCMDRRMKDSKYSNAHIQYIEIARPFFRS